MIELQNLGPEFGDVVLSNSRIEPPNPMEKATNRLRVEAGLDVEEGFTELELSTNPLFRAVAKMKKRASEGNPMAKAVAKMVAAAK